jgi:3-deoxy-D-manno-octulosonic-acid transferase
MWILYQIALSLLLAAAAPVLLVRRGRHYLPTLAGRLGGHRGRVVRGALWFHAVSVGEVMVAATVIRALPEGVPLLVTTVTPTGQARARALLGERAAVAYLPLDLGLPVRRFFRRFAPRALVLVEGDYWPLVLHHARRRGLPIAVINGRVGDTTARRLARLGRWSAPMLAPVDRFGVQSAQDLGRLAAAGVERAKITVTGNLKYESPEPPRKPWLEERLTALAAGRPVLLAGSTMTGEDEQVAEAFEAVGGGDRALLVVAPRHPERWDDVERLLARRGLAVLRRSRLEAQEGPEEKAGKQPDVVLLDSLGELAGLYALAAGAFIGGTLVPTGGHNPLEPARYGVPVAVGPSMENFRDMAAALDAAEAWRRVAGADGLAAVWRSWLDDPRAARETGRRALALIEKNRGALAATLDLLAPWVARAVNPPPPPGSPPPRG